MVACHVADVLELADEHRKELVEHRERKWHIQGCSAKTGDGIEEGIQWLMTSCFISFRLAGALLSDRAYVPSL